MPKPSSRKTIERKAAARESISTKLTDAQQIVLMSALRRSDGGGLTRPDRMTEKTAQKLAATLIEKRLAREVSARAGMPIWHRNEEGHAWALVATKLGREAIKGDDDRQNDDAGSDKPAPSSIAGAMPSDTTTASQLDRTIPRQGSKLAQVMALLGRKEGVGIEELTSTTGWLPHTTRAALTGLRKRGFAIERSRLEQGGSVYRVGAIVGLPA